MNFFINRIFKKKITNSHEYWERRYANAGNSGTGSYGLFAEYKAGIVNEFVKNNNISTVVEFGCGDGNQLQYFEFPSYIGLDISSTAVQKCQQAFKNDPDKTFFAYSQAGQYNCSNNFAAELSLSLDVVYHLLEDDVFENYMYDLFRSATSFVIIYAWDVDGKKHLHVRHRKFSAWINENINGWNLKEVIHNTYLEGACDFFIYQKQANAGSDM